MPFNDLKQMLIDFHKEWYSKMVVSEGGKLRITSQYLDQNGNHLEFKISELPDDFCQIRMTHPILAMIENSDILMMIAEKSELQITKERVGYCLTTVVNPLFIVDAFQRIQVLVVSGQMFQAILEMSVLLAEDENKSEVASVGNSGIPVQLSESEVSDVCGN